MSNFEGTREKKNTPIEGSDSIIRRISFKIPENNHGQVITLFENGIYNEDFRGALLGLKLTHNQYS